MQAQINNLIAVPAPRSGSPPAGAIAETLPRALVTSATCAMTSGTLYLAPVYLSAGAPVTSWNWVTGTTAGAGMTHWWGALLTSNYTLIAVTPDQATAAIPASSKLTAAFSAVYTPLSSGQHWWGVMVAAATMPTYNGPSAVPSAPMMAAAPPGGTSSTGLTAPGSPGTTVYNAVSTTAVPAPYGFLS